MGCAELEAVPRTPAQLRHALVEARAAAAQLRRRAIADVAARIDAVTTNWLRPDYPLRQRAEVVLPPATGFSPAMVRHGLPLMLAPLRGEALLALVEAELGDRGVLERMQAGKRASGPPLIAHVMPGNIPALAAVPIALSLLIKSAVLVKSGAGDPLFAPLFAASIRAVDEELGRCVVVADWRGGDHDMEAAAFSSADLVVASGSDAAIAALRARVAGGFIGHGHKASFAAIGKERLANADAARALARELAYAVTLWDQQGCLSPQLCYVESGGHVSATAFGELLAQALAVYASELPPRQLTVDEQAHVLRFRQEAEWAAGGVLASSGSTDWSIAIEADAEFRPSCLQRCIRLKVIADLAELNAALSAHRRHLEAAGVAVGAQRLDAVAEMLAGCGVHRICPIVTMPTPPLSWRQGGRPRVADWVEWTGVERDA